MLLPMSGESISAAQSQGYGLRYAQQKEPPCRITVVLTALVNHTKIPMLGGLLVRYYSVESPDFE